MHHFNSEALLNQLLKKQQKKPRAALPYGNGLRKVILNSHFLHF